MEDALSAADLEQIARHGLPEDRVRHQLALFRDRPAAFEVTRPATVGDGIRQIPESRREELLELYAEAESRGRFSKFVPASGAASRMFKSLAATLSGTASDADREASRRFVENLDKIPFRAEIQDHLERRGASRVDETALFSALLGDDGLAYGRRPKGLVAFHRYGEPPEVRTPFEEHLAEAARHVRDAEGRCRVHFTILESHEELFREFWAGIRPRLEERLESRFEVTFSFQEPATDTVAADLDGRPFRDEDSRLVLRPGGHGALIANLGRVGGDLVFLKNVDNVVPDSRREIVVLWKKLLGGYLLDLERRLGADLERPLRVCGVVPAAGEPGGGPFWVRDPDGSESLQIVEMSQVDTSRPGQAEVVRGSTHFNPVDLVCRLRDHRGRPFDLGRFVDPEAVFISKKSHGGRPLLALEHPGLWNGAMARWETVFVEVPAETFAPVKTVLDLLRPEHQP